MTKKYTDSDIQKMLVDIAELVPEIDPHDSEWREFLREFIASRPDIQFNEQFAQELRVRVLERAQLLKNKKRTVLPQWFKLSGMFAAGAAVCALIMVPMIRTSEFSQIQDELAPVANMKMDRMRGGSGEPEMALLTMEDAETIPEFEIDSMMVKERRAPTMLRPLPPEEDGEMAAAGTLNSEIGVSELMMAPDSSFPKIPQLSWENMPSDDQILKVATEFFMKRNFDNLSVKAPVLDKWWENNGEGNWKPEFAPDRVGVVFASGNGLEDVRIDVDTRTLEVVWMSWSQSQR